MIPASQILRDALNCANASKAENPYAYATGLLAAMLSTATQLCPDAKQFTVEHFKSIADSYKTSKHIHNWKPDPKCDLVDICSTCGEERA